MIVAKAIVAESVSPIWSEIRPPKGFEKIPIIFMRVIDRLANTVLNP